MSSMRQRLASKLLAVLGGAGLAISFCAPRANAQAAPVPPWTNANYANRYICNVTSTASAIPAGAKESFFTGIMKLSPNGSGFFQGGTLDIPLTSFTGALPSGNASANFCSYTLDASSIYTVNQDGTGGESLVWDAPSSPITGCPAGFTTTASIVLRNNVTDNNTVPRVDMTLDNFPGVFVAGTTNVSGKGYCLK